MPEDKTMFGKENKNFSYRRALKSARFSQLFLFSVIALVMVALAPPEAKGQSKHKGNPICQMIANKKLQASSGAQMFALVPSKTVRRRPRQPSEVPVLASPPRPPTLVAAPSTSVPMWTLPPPLKTSRHLE
jgi:hypothetical protein